MTKAGDDTHATFDASAGTVAASAAGIATAAFDRSPIGIAAFNSDGQMVEVNPALCRFLGYEREELLYRDVTGLTYEEDRPATLEKIELVRQGRIDGFELDKRYVRKDGAIVWANLKVSVHLGNDADPPVAIAYVADIGAAKREEARLTRRAEFDRIVHRLATDFINTPRERVDDAIAEALEQMGSFCGAHRAGVIELGAEGEAIRVSHEWMLPGLDPQGILLSEGRIGGFLARNSVLGRGEPLYVDDVLAVESLARTVREQLAALGVRSYAAVPILQGTKLVGLVGFASPIADAWDLESVSLLHIGAQMIANVLARRAADGALRESEQRFRELAENVREVFYVCDSTGEHVLYLSPAYLVVTGRPAEETYADPKLAYLAIHADDRARVRETWAREILDGRYEAEYRIVRPDGQIRWLWDRAVPVRDDDGCVRRIVGIAEDITERKASEETAARHRAELAHALRVGTMGELATGLAHELNQPLSAIANFAQGCERRLLAERPDTGEVVDAIREITRQALRAGDVIRRIRAHVRPGESRRERHDIKDLVVNAVQLLRAETGGEALTLRIEARSGAMPVFVDRIQIEQVVLNLVRNAFDAQAAARTESAERAETAGADQVTVAVTVQAGKTVEVTIADSGVGMTELTAEQMFDPFTTTKPGALGLGLSISRSIIEAHGGSMHAQAGEAGGAVVGFVLPLSEG